MTGNLTEVRLLSNVPLDNSYEHTMDFISDSTQETYFKSLTGHTLFDVTYQRAEGFVRVPKGYDSIYNCNYLMYRNSEFSGKWFYAFITKKEYVNPNMTKVHFEIDVFQTWQFEMDFKPSFVVREHTKRWNADGTPVINTLDEGLDYGSEYETVEIKQYVPFDSVYFMVIVCKQRMDVNSSEIDPTQNGVIQPLTYYVHPFKLDGTVPSIQVDGVNQTLSTLEEVLLAIYKMEVAVNNVVSLYITEHIGHSSLNFPMSKFEPSDIQDGDNRFTTLYVKNVPSYLSSTRNFGSKYSGYSSVTESKLLMYPYTVTTITDLKGNQLDIKNEYIRSNDLVIETKGSMGVNNKVAYTVSNYKMGGIANSGEVALQNGIINNSPNDVPIITEMLSAYLQGNRNQLQNQMNSLTFNSVAGLVGSAFGTVGQALARNPVGAVSGLGDMATNTMNAHFQMEGLMAKQKDLSTVPPQLQQMGGNTAFDYGNGITGIYIIKNQITSEYRKKLSDYFKMYGYKVHELKTPNLRSRQHFNYIETKGANIVGDIPHDDLMKLRKMFDSGVTVWHGNWIHDYSMENNET